MIVFVPTLYPSYSSASETVSELSAIGAPTRRLWVWLGTAYTLLMAAFGWGVWRSAGHNRALHAVGGLILVHGLIGLYWPPMHVRGAELTLTDTMHIVWSMATVLLMTLAMGFGEAPSRADGPPGLRARLRRALVLPRPSREI